MTVIDTAKNVRVDHVLVGIAPGPIAITPDGAFAYTANGNFGEGTSISVIDIVDIIANKKEPQYIGFILMHGYHNIANTLISDNV